MKMAFYISSLGKGGAERVIANLANYFAKKSQVTLILDTKKIDYKLDENIELVILDHEHKSNFILKKIKFLKYVFKLKKIFKKYNPDIIISFLAVPSFLALLARNKKSKVLVSVRNDPNTEYTTLLKKYMMKFLYPKADGFVFQTQTAKEYFSNIIHSKQKIIYNAVSESFIQYEKEHIRIEDKRIVAVGRLHYQKNFQLLINSFAKVTEEFPEYKLYIYGEGEERSKLEKIIEEKKLDEKVFLAGNVDNVPKEIFNASLYVMSSDFEGMPNSLIEAMILGIPVISTNCPCGGPRELITNDVNGMLVKINDEEGLVTSMKKVLSDDKFRKKMGIEGKKLIEKVNPSEINSQWENFIKELL